MFKPWANPRPRPLGALPPALSRRLHHPPRAPHSQPPLGALAPESPHGRSQSLRSCPAGASECAHFLPPRTCPARLERRPAGPPADVFLSPRGQREPAVPPGPKANRRAPHNWHPRQPCPRHARTRARAHTPSPARVALVLRSSTDARRSPHTSRCSTNTSPPRTYPATSWRGLLSPPQTSCRSSPLLLPLYAYLLFTAGRNSPLSRDLTHQYPLGPLCLQHDHHSLQALALSLASAPHGVRSRLQEQKEVYGPSIKSVSWCPHKGSSRTTGH